MRSSTLRHLCLPVSSTSYALLSKSIKLVTLIQSSLALENNDLVIQLGRGTQTLNFAHSRIKKYLHI